MARLIGSAPSLCRDVLDPDFAVKNAPFGYDPAINYVGSDFLRRTFGITLCRRFLGTDINYSAWLHDLGFQRGRTVAEFRAANATFRRNIVKQISAPPHPHPRWALVIGWAHWLGVESLPALIDYLLCKKD